MKAYDFQYDGRLLSSFDMVICNFGSKGLNTVSNGSVITFNTVSTLGGSKYDLTSTEYEDCLGTTIQICKNYCSGDVKEITQAEFRELTRWLNRKKFLKFKILDEDYIDLYFEASFNISRIELDGALYGLELEVLTNRPFALKEPKTVAISIMPEYVWEKYNIEKVEYFETAETYLGKTMPDDIYGYYHTYEITSDGYFKLSNPANGEGYCYIEGQSTNAKSIYRVVRDYNTPIATDYNYYLLTINDAYEYQKSDMISKVISGDKNAYPVNGIQDGYWYINVDRRLSKNGHFYITNDSYEEGYIYPHTEITIIDDGDLNIYNAMEDRNTYIANCIAGEIITMDYPVIRSSNSSHNIQNDFNWNFFRIANTFNNSRNDLTTSLPCIIKIKYSPIVKVGL